MPHPQPVETMQTPARALRFDRYVLELDRGSLVLDGNEVALRPKTFAVLRYLVENPGRLVSKDELFAAVWPHVTVTDDVLVQSIGELRRAIGDEDQRLIRTIPRRGYRFEPAVSPIAINDRPVADAAYTPESLPLPATESVDAPPPASVAGKPLARIGFVAILGLAVVGASALLYGALTEWRHAGGSPSMERRAINTAHAKPAIAILPLLNQSEDQGRDYFADGLTQDIISALGRFSELTVMSWNAVFPYKGRPAPPAEIAQRLAVRYQVEGSVRRTGDRLRVSARLVGADGQVLWSDSFDENLADVFSLQGKITDDIAGSLAIRVTLNEQRRALAKPTENLEAYDYVLRARPALQRPTRAGIVEARALLRQAIQIDPNYAAAYSALAETYYVSVSMGWAQSAQDFLGRADDLARKALSLNDLDVRAHTILGRIHLFYQRHERAKAEIDRAMAINPSDAQGLAGRGNILMWSGETNAAAEALELAQRIDPELSAIDRFALGLAYYLQRRYEAAIEQAELNLRKTDGAHFSRILLAVSYAQLGRSNETARVLDAIRRTDPTFEAHEFGTKFLRSDDLAHLREGLRKAGLYQLEHAPPNSR